MPSERTRNTIVGLTIILACGVAVAGMSFLNVIPKIFKPKPYELRLEATNAANIQPGAKVNLSGVQVGTVKSVALIESARPVKPDEEPLPLLHALVTLSIDADRDIPDGTTAAIGAQGINFSGATVSLNPPKVFTGVMLPKDGSASLYAGASDSGLLPKEVFADLSALQGNITRVSDEIAKTSRQITLVGEDLHTLLIVKSVKDGKLVQDDPNVPLENIFTLVFKLNETIDHVNSMFAAPLGPDGKPLPEDPMKPQNLVALIAKLNKTADFVNGIISDKSLPAHISAILANLADASAQLKEVLATVKATVTSANGAITDISTAAKGATSTLDTAQVQIIAISQNLAATLKTLDASVIEITTGNGTTGKLVKDSKLYDGLVDLTRSLQGTSEDLNKLIHQWKEDGVPLKVGLGK